MTNTDTRIRELSPAEVEHALLPTWLRAQRTLTYFVLAHFVFGLAIAPVFGTWRIALGVGGLSTLAFLATTRLAPGTFLARAMTGVSIQVFVAQHIYQLHGLAEMHFFFFTAFAAMIAYLDWMAMWPGTLLIIAQHVSFALLHNSGVQLYFFEDDYVGVSKLAFHFGIGIVHVSVCGTWAHSLRLRVLRDYAENRDLEAKVKERTQELARTASDLRVLLDNVGQGFVAVDRAGMLGPVHSEVLSHWFGPRPSSDRLVDWLSAHDPRFVSQLALGLDALFEDVMPLELTLDQMPSRMRSGAQLFAVTYRIIGEPSQPEARLVVILTDHTAESERARAEASQRDLVAAIDRILRDKAGFLEFFAESSELVRRLAAGDGSRARDERRDLHTLKGNTGIYGLHSLSQLCHELENAIEREELDTLTKEQRSELGAAWHTFSQQLRMLVESPQDDALEVDHEEWRALIDAVAANEPHAGLLRRIRAWKLEPTKKRLERVGQQAHRLAERIGRAPLSVTLHDGGLRLPRARWAPFWSAFVHVLRNALDHGIEPAEARVAAGKATGGTLILRTEREARGLVISLADDGAGIDWERVAAKAEQLGLPLRNQAERVRALFADGMSTRDEISETSGRGVGLAGFEREVVALGGTIEVESERGRGTTFRVLFPPEREAELTAPDDASMPVHLPAPAPANDVERARSAG